MKYAVLVAAVAMELFAQPRTVAVSGTVVDSSGGFISGASVAMNLPGRDAIRTTTGVRGDFHFDAVAPGAYELRVEFDGFAPYQSRVNVDSRAPNPVQAILSIAELQDTLKVEGAADVVSPDTSQNADVVHLNPRELDNLPMLDRDVIAAVTRSLGLGSLAAGGATVIVDGLQTTERGIPLSEVQEVIINSNPYSAEYAQPGKARIEILTKTGSPEFHGSIFLGVRDYRLDARNAFATERPPERHRQLDGDLSGPIPDKNNTFRINFSHVDDNLEPSVYALGLAGPILENSSQSQVSTYGSAQYTHRIGASAISFRYTHYDWADRGEGTGALVLPASGTNSKLHYEQLFTGFRAILSPTVLNDLFVRLRYQDTDTSSELPGAVKVVVQNAFTSGGAQVQSTGTETGVDLADVLSWTRGKHLIKAGVSVPTATRIGAHDQSDFNGTFYFSSLADYAAGTPYAFTRQAGDGRVVFTQQQVGGFIQDEISVRPNFSLAAGVRYDWQNFGSERNIAPRLSLAYAPGKSRKTVFRSGAGFFFQPLPSSAIADTLLLNGSRLEQIQILNPLYPNPLVGPLSGFPPNIVRFSHALKSPYLIDYSGGIEQQLQKSLTWTATFSATRGVDMFRSRDVNAPLPPAYVTPPNPSLGVVREIETSGALKSQSLSTTLRGDMTRFFNGMVMYEFNHASNDTNGIDSFPANNWTTAGEWSRASTDARHFVYVYGTFTAGKLFTLGAIFSANSGRPYNMITGLDSFNDGMINARPPGVSRNSLVGSGSATLDLSWSRRFALATVGQGQKISLNVGVDAFNIFNRVNYAAFVGDLSSPFFGKPVSADPARRMQLSLALKF